jgi:hypothetical protein
MYMMKVPSRDALAHVYGTGRNGHNEHCTSITLTCALSTALPSC